MREVFLIRHSEALKNVNNDLNNDILQLVNEKNPLSIAGEERAKKLSEIDELDNIDVVISSNYVRTMATAKYIASRNNVSLNVIDGFGERRFGINSWAELPDGFEKRQFNEIDFKIENGESRREVADRMYNNLIYVLNNYYQDRIVIVSHATSITFLLMKIGEMKEGNLVYKDRVVIPKDFSWQAPDGFKLTFDGKELVDISHINLDFYR